MDLSWIKVLIEFFQKPLHLLFIGIALVCCLKINILFLVVGICLLFLSLAVYILNMHQQSKVEKRLYTLSSLEKQKFIEALNSKTQTIQDYYHNPICIGLCDKELLGRPSEICSSNMNPFTIPDFIWEKLKKMRSKGEI